MLRHQDAEKRQQGKQTAGQDRVESQITIMNAEEFAKEIFGHVDLGHQSRVNRAVAALSIVAHRPTEGFVKACGGDTAAKERLYRFVADSIRDVPQLIAGGCSGFAQSIEQRCQGDIVLAEDTTSYGFARQVREELGDLGAGEAARRRGFFSHVTLAVERETGLPLGPVDLQLAIRPVPDPKAPRLSPAEKKKRRDATPYEIKESFKWEASLMAVDERCANYRHRLIFVSDRESDVYEYMTALVGSDLRFVIRSSWNRKLKNEKHLREHIAQQPPRATVQVRMEQKGGRPARDALLQLRTDTVTFVGKTSKVERFPDISVNVVHLTEPNPPQGIEPTEWLLLSSEPTTTVEEAMEILKIYCLRWLVEEYNKCCKSDGTNIEELKMQSRATLISAAVLCMFAAVPLMQLRGDLLGADWRARWPRLIEILADHATKQEGVAVQHSQKQKDVPVQHSAAQLFSQSHRETPAVLPCTEVLPEFYWKTLWLAVERKRPLPNSPPTLQWALLAVARLGGWGYRSSRRPGYPVLWTGWIRLLDRIDAILLASSLPLGPYPILPKK